MSLIDALASLREQGYQIVYSNDLVTTSQRIDVAVVNFDSVQIALAKVGLTLSRRADIWLVVRNDGRTAVADTPSRLHQGANIAAAEFQFGRRGERTYVNGSDGLFVVKWPAYAVNAITIRARDHYPRTLPLSEVDGTIVLQPIEQIENVIVTGSRYLVPAQIALGSSTSVTADEMSGVPALAGDSMRVTNRLPGMSSVGVSAKPLVRGGVEDETLTVIDGVELLDPFHLADFQNIFSSIDSRIVDQIDVYTGAFPARYGNRMSGVVDISAQPPDVAPRTEIGLSVLAAFANTRGESDDDADRLARVGATRQPRISRGLDRSALGQADVRRRVSARRQTAERRRQALRRGHLFAGRHLHHRQRPCRALGYRVFLLVDASRRYPQRMAA